MDIAYTCQENYAQIAGVSIFSLLKNNPNEKITIHFLDSGLSEGSKEEYRKMCKKHGSSYIYFYDVSNLINEYSDRLTAFKNNFATYAKLFIEILIPKSVKNCLYIDADTLVRGNIKKIFEINYNSTLAMNNDLVYPEFKTNIGFSANDLYFNAGVIFIDFERWRNNNYTDKIISFILNGKKFEFGDQDIFNNVFKNDISQIGMEYNYITQFYFYKTYGMCRNFFKVTEDSFITKEIYENVDPIIVHFTYIPFILRPWFEKSNHPMKKEYLSYIAESPFYENFKIQKIKQPIKRKFFQFILGKKINLFFAYIIAGFAKRANLKRYA